MQVLVACEFSGRVRDAFIAMGHEAISCDIVPSETPGPHYLGDVRDILDDGWDLMIAFPPCTYLTTSGARWWKDRISEQREALAFVRTLLAADIPRIALENPVGVINSSVRPATQIIQPWQFGHGETKSTCLWLKNLPPLVPTDVVEGREQRILAMGQSAGRTQERSLTYLGVAQAMAQQWGSERALSEWDSAAEVIRMSEEKRPGRPRLPEGEAKTATLRTMVRPRVAEAFRSIALSHGMSVSEAVGEAILDWVRKKSQAPEAG